MSTFQRVWGPYFSLRHKTLTALWPRKARGVLQSKIQAEYCALVHRKLTTLNKIVKILLLCERNNTTQAKALWSFVWLSEARLGHFCFPLSNKGDFPLSLAGIEVDLSQVKEDSGTQHYFLVESFSLLPGVWSEAFLHPLIVFSRHPTSSLRTSQSSDHEWEIRFIARMGIHSAYPSG